MTVVFGVSEAPFPYVCALYRCDCACGCGGRTVQRGRHAGTPPAGWAALIPSGASRHLCGPCCADGDRPRCSAPTA